MTTKKERLEDAAESLRDAADALAEVDDSEPNFAVDGLRKRAKEYKRRADEIPDGPFVKAVDRGNATKYVPVDDARIEPNRRSMLATVHAEDGPLYCGDGTEHCTSRTLWNANEVEVVDELPNA